MAEQEGSCRRNVNWYENRCFSVANRSVAWHYAIRFRSTVSTVFEAHDFMARVPPFLKCIILMMLLAGVGVAATSLLETTGMDLRWAGAFYTEGGANGGWAHARAIPWTTLYNYGELPGLVFGVVCLAVCLLSRAGKAPGKYVKPCLVVVLTLILGPGLAVNGILKNYWGRPRPEDVWADGGPLGYKRVCEQGTPGIGKSFTCGHCSVAFSLSSGAAFYPYHPVAASLALVGGVAYGLMMGVARMAQGGHFPTDVLWSGIIVLAIVNCLYYLVFRIPRTFMDEG